MNVVLTHGYFLRDDPKEQRIMKPYPPLGLLYIAAWLEKNGIANDVFDTTFTSREMLFEFLIQKQPGVIGLYTNLMTKVVVVQLIQWIRNNNLLRQCVIVLGGPDTRYNIDAYLNTGADIVVFGEGEVTMAEIINTVNQGNRTEFGHIDGLAYQTQGQTIQTKERERIRPIDNIPWPARSKISMQSYLNTWKKNHGHSAMTVSTQRGCPYTCKWCSTAVYGQSYRRRSPSDVVRELKFIKAQYTPDSIWFVDDVFTVSHKWLQEFRDLVMENNLDLPYECITRADRMNETVISWLKESGCFRVWIGAESGSQKVIDLMDRRVDVHQVRKMIQLSRRKGIETGTFIMLGYPGETEDDIKETIKHLKESSPDLFTITIAYPIKGTSLFEHIDVAQNQLLDWDKTTDRDRMLHTTYSKKYYYYAVRWVEHEVKYFKACREKNRNYLHITKHKIKSILAKSFLQLLKRV